jgi:hypothetical protein
MTAAAIDAFFLLLQVDDVMVADVLIDIDPMFKVQRIGDRMISLSSASLWCTEPSARWSHERRLPVVSRDDWNRMNE